MGTPSASPSGSGRTRPRAQTPAPRPPMGTSDSPSPIVVAEIERFGSATEKSIRPEIDHAATERLTVQGPAQSGR